MTGEEKESAPSIFSQIETALPRIGELGVKTTNLVFLSTCVYTVGWK